MRRGLMIVLSSPSGAGKSSLARALLSRDGNIVPSVSVTTRSPRPSEVDGIHYRFVTPSEFDGIASSDGLLESARVHGNLYGTPRAPVEAALSSGKDVIFDIDWQGTLQLYEKAREDIVSVFLLPPSARELRSRLFRRAEDSDEVIARRLANARDEIKRWKAYDHVLVNSDFTETFDRLTSIVGEARATRDVVREAARRATGLVVELDDLVRELYEGLADLDAPQPTM